MIKNVDDLKERIPELKKIKPNPNGYKIIDKYNKKIYNAVKFELFNVIDNVIEEEIIKAIDWNEFFKESIKYTPISDISIGEPPKPKGLVASCMYMDEFVPNAIIKFKGDKN